MNIEQLLNEAEQAMLECTDHSAYRYWIYVSHEELLCRPALLVYDETIRIFHLTRNQLEHGLTNDEWFDLGMKMMKIYKELNLCPLPQKH